MIKNHHIKVSYLFFIVFACTLSSCKDSKNNISIANVKKGESLFSSVGCITCHSLTSDKLYGPSLNDIFKKEIKVIKKGAEHTVLVDRNYLERSIVDPDFEKPAVFKNSKMPTPNLTTKEIDCLIDYIISMNLKNTKTLDDSSL